MVPIRYKPVNGICWYAEYQCTKYQGTIFAFYYTALLRYSRYYATVRFFIRYLNISVFKLFVRLFTAMNNVQPKYWIYCTAVFEMQICTYASIGTPSLIFIGTFTVSTFPCYSMGYRAVTCYPNFWYTNYT